MREVKVGGLHKVSMWDFVQVVVVATRILETRFGSWELPQVSGTSEGRRRGCLGASRFDAGSARFTMQEGWAFAFVGFGNNFSKVGEVVSWGFRRGWAA
ncbi:Disease resistance protein TIR-NBS-LRR class family [Prunus dulcis]|uniref:Disease resistance protein TIR-NBS-LRR class family n=1 Tax=Prunus dulcis TaxID=3755 RepID=A0A4Y1QL50_PRUDU|nr:Disease resistance protein TIR-NBS-LRR class family [Prunus dulcis]